ncbi:hypothetical protein SNEBB_001033 [Seison nebaliae]|nr:hypothetical protein SNEBB_001033 [Seison nebaliae]
MSWKTGSLSAHIPSRAEMNLSRRNRNNVVNETRQVKHHQDYTDWLNDQNDCARRENRKTEKHLIRNMQDSLDGQTLQFNRISRLLNMDDFWVSQLSPDTRKALGITDSQMNTANACLAAEDNKLRQREEQRMKQNPSLHHHNQQQQQQLQNQNNMQRLKNKQQQFDDESYCDDYDDYDTRSVMSSAGSRRLKSPSVTSIRSQHSNRLKVKGSNNMPLGYLYNRQQLDDWDEDIDVNEDPQLTVSRNIERRYQQKHAPKFDRQRQNYSNKSYYDDDDYQLEQLQQQQQMKNRKSRLNDQYDEDIYDFEYPTISQLVPLRKNYVPAPSRSALKTSNRYNTTINNTNDSLPTYSMNNDIRRLSTLTRTTRDRLLGPSLSNYEEEQQKQQLSSRTASHPLQPPSSPPQQQQQQQQVIFDNDMELLKQQQQQQQLSQRASSVQPSLKEPFISSTGRRSISQARYAGDIRARTPTTFSYMPTRRAAQERYAEYYSKYGNEMDPDSTPFLATKCFNGDDGRLLTPARRSQSTSFNQGTNVDDPYEFLDIYVHPLSCYHSKNRRQPHERLRTNSVQQQQQQKQRQQSPKHHDERNRIEFHYNHFPNEQKAPSMPPVHLPHSYRPAFTILDIDTNKDYIPKCWKDEESQALANRTPGYPRRTFGSNRFFPSLSTETSEKSPQEYSTTTSTTTTYKSPSLTSPSALSPLTRIESKTAKTTMKKESDGTITSMTSSNSPVIESEELKMEKKDDSKQLSTSPQPDEKKMLKGILKTSSIDVPSPVVEPTDTGKSSTMLDNKNPADSFVLDIISSATAIVDKQDKAESSLPSPPHDDGGKKKVRINEP